MNFPNEGLARVVPRFRSASRHWVWLKALKASKRISRLDASLQSRVLFERIRSQLLIPLFSRNWLGPDVPRRKSRARTNPWDGSPKARNASALNARLLFLRGSIVWNGAPRSAKLRTPPPVPVVLKVLLTVKGNPD